VTPRRLGIAALGLAFALLITACDSSVSPEAARVNGSSISEQTLDDALNGLQSSPAFACIVSGGGQVALHGKGGSSTYSAAVSAELLTTLIDGKLLQNAAQHLGLSLTPIGRKVAEDESASQLGPTSTSTCKTAGATVLQSLPASFRAAFLSLAQARTELGAKFAGVALDADAIEAYARAHPKVSELYCVSAIITSTKPAAQALVSAARSGASFSDLAKAHSIDPTSAARGGALGCALSGQLTSQLQGPVLALGIGQVSEPISFDGSFVVLQLTSKKQASDEDVASVIEQSVNGQLSTYLKNLQKNANVEVDARYGKWQNAAGGWQVTPPSGPAAKYLPNASAL
jgi:parvulin-like peptidyl-prolyl isomerase